MSRVGQVWWNTRQRTVGVVISERDEITTVIDMQGRIHTNFREWIPVHSASDDANARSWADAMWLAEDMASGMRYALRASNARVVVDELKAKIAKAQADFEVERNAILSGLLARGGGYRAYPGFWRDIKMQEWAQSREYNGFTATGLLLAEMPGNSRDWKQMFNSAGLRQATGAGLVFPYSTQVYLASGLEIPGACQCTNPVLRHQFASISGYHQTLKDRRDSLGRVPLSVISMALNKCPTHDLSLTSDERPRDITEF